MQQTEKEASPVNAIGQLIIKFNYKRSVDF